ncbi:MAG: hypothetical protein KC547_06645 [Anaerolineae bacterium]|nr:hypothetical protein [Anaerolineae bacterium]
MGYQKPNAYFLIYPENIDFIEKRSKVIYPRFPLSIHREIGCVVLGSGIGLVALVLSLFTQADKPVLEIILLAVFFLYFLGKLNGSFKDEKLKKELRNKGVLLPGTLQGISVDQGDLHDFVYYKYYFRSPSGQWRFSTQQRVHNKPVFRRTPYRMAATGSNIVVLYIDDTKFMML